MTNRNNKNGAEQILEPYESCNLSEIFLNNITSSQELYNVARLLYKTQKAVTQMKYLFDESTRIINKNARIGIGVTGITQSLDKLEWLDLVYTKLREYDKVWSKERGWNKSIKITTLKPSGTLSLLAGSSPGIHPAYAPYYIRRMRIASNHTLVAYAKAHGYEVEYQKNFDGTDDYNTSVISFPCKVEALYARDVSAVDQLELVKKLQTVWSDSSVSVTVYYRLHELPAIQAWLQKHFETSIKSVSFLLHNDHGFIQAPYEEISAAQYDAMNSFVLPLTSFQEFIELDLDECATGACPIR